MKTIIKIEQTGLFRLLLLLDEKPRFISELKKDSFNPKGIGSLATVYACRDKAVNLGLITVTTEDVPPFRTYFTITKRGQKVVEKIREIQEILEKE